MRKRVSCIGFDYAESNSVCFFVFGIESKGFDNGFDKKLMGIRVCVELVSICCWVLRVVMFGWFWIHVYTRGFSRDPRRVDRRDLLAR